MERKEGINPVTIRPSRADCKNNVTLGRMWVSREPNEAWIKNLVVCIYDPDRIEESTVTTVLDENHFIEALGHLFPNGELAHCHERAVP